MNAETAIRRALDLLTRASADWRNGYGCDSGALHWPVAVNLARRELRQALEVLEQPAPDASRCPHCGGTGFEGDEPCEFCDASGRNDDARAGIAWYNGLTIAERRHWHQLARSAVPADAWEAYKAGGPQS